MKSRVFNQTYRHSKGYTLVEMVIAVSLVSMLMAGVMTFLVQNAKDQFDASHRMAINSDIRKFTQELVRDARSANSYFIYKSNKNSDRAGIGNRKRHGESGNLLVLMHHELFPNIFHVDSNGNSLYGSSNLEMRLFRMVLIYKDTDDDESPIYQIRREWNVENAPELTQTNAETLIDDVFNEFLNERVLVKEARGLVNGDLFTNLGNNRTIVVQCEIISGHRVRFLTNTYNFTISPRG